MTKENTQELPLEVRLSAYLDGQLDERETRDTEALLATDANAREILNLLKAGSEFGNQVFDEMLKEPVPLDLVRAIKSAAPAESVGGGTPVASNNNVFSFFRYIPQAVAASAVLLIAGGYAGYFVGQRSAEAPFEIADTGPLATQPGLANVKTRGFTFDEAAPAPAAVQAIGTAAVAGIHDVYSVQTTRLAEMPASQLGDLTAWLSASTGIKFNVPDLSSDGLTFEGGRLVALDGRPAGALFYRNGEGQVIGVYFTRGNAAEGQSEIGNNRYLSGTKDDVAWFVAGPKTDANLKDVADRAAEALAKFPS